MNDVIPFKGQKIAKAFAGHELRKLGEGIAGGFSSINYRGKVWTLNHQGQNHPFKREDDGSALTYLDVIIISENPNISKMYYPQGEWDEDSAGPPVCTSLNGVRPENNVKEKQSELCGTCKWNAWTTLPTGRKGKVCQDHKRLAVLLMPAMTKKLLGAPLTDPVYLKVPPGSLNSLKTYGEILYHEGYPPYAVVTRISFSTDPNKMFQMVFEGKKVLSDVEAPLVQPLLDNPQTRRITGEEPETRDVTPAVREEKFETGLEEAFAPPPARPAPVHAVTNGSGAEPEAPQPAKKRGRPPKAAGSPEREPLPESTIHLSLEDTELDDEVANLLNAKIDNMLK